MPAGRAIAEKVSHFGIASPAGFVAMTIFYAVVNSLLEEYYWRWFVFGQMRRFLPPAAAIAVSSLAFALHHVIVLAFYFGWRSPATRGIFARRGPGRRGLGLDLSPQRLAVGALVESRRGGRSDLCRRLSVAAQRLGLVVGNWDDKLVTSIQCRRQHACHNASLRYCSHFRHPRFFVWITRRWCSDEVAILGTTLQHINDRPFHCWDCRRHVQPKCP